ncbi:MAG: molybdate ABC transporter substrate-binding protein [Myxococcota bacterium]
MWLSDSLRTAMTRVIGVGSAVSIQLVLVMLGSVDAARAEGAAESERSALRILAAASLTEVVQALAQDFPEGPVVTSFGGSSDLARQIADGAPADVFLSASREWVTFLEEGGRVDREALTFARNALVCIAPRSGRLAGEGHPADPAALVAALDDDDLVAIANPGVPAGEYARAALDALGLLSAIEPRLVGQKDVRAVLHAVEQGEVTAGIVYATDARVADVATLFAFDPSTQPAIAYVAVVLRASPRIERARRFLAFLASGSTRARLSKAGFVVPPSAVLP